MRKLIVSVLALTLSVPVFAGTLSGVTMPDTAELGGQKLVLNGLGLREKYFIDVYVGGLYLPAKTTDANKAINDDVPKRIFMQFTYDLSQEKLAETMRESIAAAGSATAAQKADLIASWMEDVKPGDSMAVEYVPGKGTTFVVKGKAKGTVEGAEFMKAIFGVYLGPKPPTADLKKGLMGQ